MLVVNYMADELFCYLQNYCVDKVYGFSWVEYIIWIGDQLIVCLVLQLVMFMYGNLSDGYFIGLFGFMFEQVWLVEMSWNDLMIVLVQNCWLLMFLLYGFEWNLIDKGVMFDEFDEWLICFVCFGFGVLFILFFK